MSQPIPADPRVQFQIWFASLFREGRALTFPCDALGNVELDQLSERGRNNYFFARAQVGHEFAAPSVRRR